MAYTCVMTGPADIAARELGRLLAGGPSAGSGAGADGLNPGSGACEQAAEAMRWILEQGGLLSGRRLRIEALAMMFDTFRVSRRNDCRYCGDDVSFPGLVDYDDGCRAS